MVINLLGLHIQVVLLLLLNGTLLQMDGEVKTLKELYTLIIINIVINLLAVVLNRIRWQV